jgi:glycosyltransferase involved in cell wall biosynthesis
MMGVLRNGQVVENDALYSLRNGGNISYFNRMSRTGYVMTINIYGSLNLIGAQRSWGIVLTNFAIEILRAGYNVECFSNNGTTNIDPRIRGYMVSSLNPENVCFTYCTPPELLKIKATHIYVMGAYESSILPMGWADMLNRENVTPIVNSTWQRNIFRENGVDAKIIPLGVDTDIYNPFIAPMNLGNDKFKFLSIGIPHARKGFDILLRAFADEFKPDENVALVIKTQKIEKPNYWEIDICKEIAKVQQNPTAQIILISGDCANLAPLYTACDCYVSPTRAEGFGMTVLEATACGLPTIATIGPFDFVYNYGLEQTKVKAHAKYQYHTFNPEAMIFEPSVSDLMAGMRKMFLKPSLKPAQSWYDEISIKEWTWRRAIEKLISLIFVDNSWDIGFQRWVKLKKS